MVLIILAWTVQIRIRFFLFFWYDDSITELLRRPSYEEAFLFLITVTTSISHYNSATEILNTYGSTIAVPDS